MATFSLADYTKALDDKFGTFDLDLGDAGSFSLTRHGRMTGKQKADFDKIDRQAEALMHEMMKYEGDSERYMSDIWDEVRKTKVERMILASGGSKEFRKWIEDQPSGGQDLLWDEYTQRSEAGEA